MALPDIQVNTKPFRAISKKAISYMKRQMFQCFHTWEYVPQTDNTGRNVQSKLQPECFHPPALHRHRDIQNCYVNPGMTFHYLRGAISSSVSPHTSAVIGWFFSKLPFSYAGSPQDTLCQTSDNGGDRGSHFSTPSQHLILSLLLPSQPRYDMAA